MIRLAAMTAPPAAARLSSPEPDAPLGRASGSGFQQRSDSRRDAGPTDKENQMATFTVGVFVGLLIAGTFALVRALRDSVIDRQREERYAAEWLRRNRGQA